MLVDLILTIFGYLLVPIIIVLLGKKYPESTLKKIAICNTISVWLIFAIIVVNAGGDANNAGGLIWGFVGYWIMKKKCLEENEK